jgi:hypothetical protein
MGPTVSAGSSNPATPGSKGLPRYGTAAARSVGRPRAQVQVADGAATVAPELQVGEGTGMAVARARIRR